MNGPASRIAVLVVALVLAVAGCGSPSTPSPPVPPPPPPPSAVAPTAVAPAPTAPSAPAAPSVPSAPSAPASPRVTTARVPGQLLDLANWKLTLPTGQKGKKNKPEEIEEPELSSFTNDFFRLNDTRDGVVFTANAGGVTTSGSSYARSELREMNGSEKASWSNKAGTHVLRVRQAVTKLPKVKPHVVTAQIHDADDDVIEVRLEGRRLLVEYDDGDHEVTLDGAYVLGTPYDLEITAAGGRVRVSYNGKRMADIDKRGSGWYFKTGSYVQSNPRRGDAPDARSQVVLYSLRVRHVP